MDGGGRRAHSRPFCLRWLAGWRQAAAEMTHVGTVRYKWQLTVGSCCVVRAFTWVEVHKLPPAIYTCLLYASLAKADMARGQSPALMA